MKKNRLKVFTAGIMAAAFILAGCGRSDTSTAAAEDYYYAGASETAMPAAGIRDYSGVQSMIATRTTIRKLIAAMNMMIVFFMAHIVAYQHYRIIVATLKNVVYIQQQA